MPSKGRKAGPQSWNSSAGIEKPEGTQSVAHGQRTDLACIRPWAPNLGLKGQGELGGTSGGGRGMEASCLFMDT